MAVRPLEGIRVCDLTWIVAGPTCTRILADFGADVIKVEHEQSLDSVRFGRPIVGGPPNMNNSGFWNYLNRNKRSALINVRHPRGTDILKRLIATSDVLVENFSADVLSSWSLDWPQLEELNPRLVYCSISGFGHTGPDRHFTTWGPTAQALSGLTFMSGLPEAPPAGWGYSFMDHTAGYYAAIAVMMALHHRNRTGRGQHIDLSQVEAGIVLTGPAILDFTVNGRPWRREGMPPGNRAWQPSVAPHNAYRCAGDDRWVAIAVTSDAEWQALVRAMGDPGALTVEEFSTTEGRLENQNTIDREIGKWAIKREDYAVMYTLQAAGVKAGAVQKASDRFERDAQLRARGWWSRLDHPEIGPSDYDGVTPRLSRTPGRVEKASPVLGADTRDVLEGVLGMTPAEVDECEAMGVFM